MRKYLIAASIAALSLGQAHAANLPTPAPAAVVIPVKAPAGGYPTMSGFYWGLNAMGAENPINNGPVGAQVVQGDIGLTLGYTWAVSQANFTFVEALGDWANLNGTQNGLALTGPLHFEERVGFGGPIGSMLNLLPNLNFPAVPSLPVIPTGVTAAAGNPYLYAALHEQDISASFIGVSNGHEWIINPEVGIGMLTRLSNNVVIDTWAGLRMGSNSFCIGPVGCPKEETGASVGLAAKY